MAEIASVKEFFEAQLPGRLAAKPDVVSKIGAVYLFNVSGPDGGTWTVDCGVPGGKVTPGNTGTPGCTVTTTDKDLLAILNGKLNPEMAFMSGKLRVDNIALAMKMKLVLQ